jgi:hypothetical protein
MVIEGRRRARGRALPVFASFTLCSVAMAAATAPPPADSSAAIPAPANCLPSKDGYLRARVAGAVEARVDWPDKGTRCEGESRDSPSGVRLSFQRIANGDSNLLFVFGLTGVGEGRPAKEVGANLTLIVQGTDRIYGTLGDSRCTVDSLKQKRLGSSKAYRVEARGFCTQPAHAVRGDGAVLVSTFEFAGLVNYDTPAGTDIKTLIPKEMTPVK